MNGSSYAKIPSRSPAMLNFEKDDKYCFLRSFLAHLHPCNNSHLNRVSDYREYLNDINLDGFDHGIGFRCSDGHKFENLNDLCIKLFGVGFLSTSKKKKNITYYLLKLV